MSFDHFKSRIQTQFPHDWELFLASLENEPHTSIRYNPRKMESIPPSDIPWARYGHYLSERPSFTFDPEFHVGKYYVQESSSMFIDFVLGRVKKEIFLDKVLDLCAAPGGKSTIILDHLDSHQFLVANEMIPQRNSVLRENLTKWGYPNFLVTENKPADFKALAHYFDCILLDAPCSGEGLFRKDKNARNEWSLGVANMCSERQCDIFKSVWSSLKEGGILIYSTCTYNPDENEKLLEKLLLDDFEFETIPLDIPGEWNIDVVKSQNTIGYRFLPNKVKGEGFFCSVLRKKGSYKQQETKLSKDHINPWLGQYISTYQLANYSTYKFKNSLFLSPSLLLDELTILSRSLYIKQIGIEIAQYKGMELEPEQGLILLAHEVLGFDKIELSLDETIAFLSHSELTLNLENGYHLVMHNRLPLGWIKVEKSKLINLYPQGWKIRTKKLNR